MATFCPQCKEPFDEGSGLCPRDGTPLEVVNDPPPDAHERLVGTILDERYQIERVLGQGGMGVVFLARHVAIEKMVAVKVLRRDAAHDQSVVERFVEEAKAASRIGHPGVVGITDFGTTPEGMTYLVMEYVEGDTLDHVIATQAPMAPSRALFIAAQIARALGAAHDSGVVHRGLEPHDIFVFDKEGRDFVKIVDFGAARVRAVDSDPASTRPTRAGAILGTPEYMAPEQAAGRSDMDHRVDIYALGIILYEMIVGQVPHQGEHTMGTLAMQMFDPIEPPKKALPGLAISDELEQVMLRALAKDPDERFSSVHELARALERAGERAHQWAPGVVAKAAPDAPERHDRERLAGQRRWLLLAAALVLLAGGGVTAALLAGGSETNESAGLQPGAAGASKTAREQASRGDAEPRVPDAAVPATLSDASPGPDAPMSAAAVSEKGRHRPPRRNETGARRQIDIQVVTIPNFANLYIDKNYSGTSGTTIRKPEGTVVEVECRLEGYLPGRVKVRFDGRQEVYECELTFIERCIQGIKNPFDDCPE